nr:unnamed protein product [Callosobruchus analis]
MLLLVGVEQHMIQQSSQIQLSGRDLNYYH